jgi:hypothetical protein
LHRLLHLLYIDGWFLNNIQPLFEKAQKEGKDVTRGIPHMECLDVKGIDMGVPILLRGGKKVVIMTSPNIDGDVQVGPPLLDDPLMLAMV